SSNALLFILYLLAKNPDKQQKLRDEVISNSGSKVYMRACIKEAMRILPAAPENSRVTTREYDVLGYRIPKDMTIMLGHQLMCTMENYYPKANQYIPERWIVNKDNPLYQDRANSFAYSPFGFGVRMCIGRRIVEAEIEALLTRLMENFHIGWDGPSPNIKHTFINGMVEPLSTACKFSTCTPHRQLKSWKEIPGPSSVPVIGQLHHFLPGGSLHNCTGFEFQDKLYTNYGPIVKLDRIFAGRPGIFVYDLDSVAQSPNCERLNFYNQPKGGATQPTGLIIMVKNGSRFGQW
ncbi:unnamed protein product, partial [Leptidea sinapis]